MHRWAAGVLMVLLLAGCAAENDPKSRFLRGDPCKPPCFEGITPGETSIQEAQEALRNQISLGATDPVIQMYGERPLLEWSYSESEWSGRANSGAQGSANSPIIGLSVAVPDLCLSEIIDAHGDPQRLFVAAYQSSGWVVVIWDEMGMLYSSNADDEPGGVIETEPCGGAVEFIAANGNIRSFPSLALYSSTIDEYMVRWEGMDHDYGVGEFQLPVMP